MSTSNYRDNPQRDVDSASERAESFQDAIETHTRKQSAYIKPSALPYVDAQSAIYNSGLPLSGFKTPYISSGRWADTGKGNETYGTTTHSSKNIQGEEFVERGIYDIFDRYYDPYPAWNPSDKVPITRKEIETIFIHLTEIFGFQMDNTRNMFDHLLRLLDSRASRVGPIQALRSLHADYVGGINANFKKWYFAAQLDIDDSIGFENVKSNGVPKNSKVSEEFYSLEQAESRWSANMNSLSPTDCVIQIALYLLCWGEANNIRFMPECLCFIFKCCNDYYYSLDIEKPVQNITSSFLDHVITPLYEFYRDQSYENVNGRIVRREKDHKDIIGYDDMNQLFWYRKGLERIVIADRKTKLVSLPPSERYLYLNQVLWTKGFYKTYKERRSWSHVIVNFNRIWIIHIAVFWFYTSFNSPTLYVKDYQQNLDNNPTLQARLAAMAIAGPISSVIDIIATVFEFSFVPRKWPGAESLFKRLAILVFIFLINFAPIVYVFAFLPLNEETTLGLAFAISSFILSIFVVAYLSVMPLGGLFGSYLNKNERKYLPSKYFSNSVYKLRGTDQISSYGLWFAVFLSKFTESYYFLTLSLRDPVRELSMMHMNRCVGDVYIGKLLCRYQPTIVLALIFSTDIALFFLDTYLWYIIWNTIFSVCRSFYIGVSIWTPWRNIFSRLPKRIFSKIISTRADRTTKAKILVSQVWNSIIISMYREHLLSLENVQRLIYQQVISPNGDGNVLKEPTFFVSQEDQSLKSSLFDTQSEAQRRITYFAQSLSTPMPEACSTNAMPTFTVLIPHYSEKITLSLREIIKEEDQYSHVTLLEYLKQLHPLEWSCFVRDTKMLAEELDTDSASLDYTTSKEKNDDLPYYSVGFKVATPEYILRTRIWASLRSQTLYRTVSGFMNYSRAIKLLFDIENANADEFEQDEQIKLEEASIMALRKFRIIVSMQRMNGFSEEEQENKEFLLRAYPELQISYLEEEISADTGEITYYSALIDGSCEIMENGDRKPKYRIRLSGNPILGDGKSDNQNHAIIFCRGEYIQLVDANQDNYLEECLKIRSVLAEFEEKSYPLDVYSNDMKCTDYVNPVAIIGTREYIFSENIGILGDVAAGKEQTFGTLFARTLAQIGGKLHYGHPDFLNGVFMTTRGGVSKAQRGLHLNEDIYAGMNAMLRGGRIKHCEYIQCGKGRDLGFGSILNFTTKIGAGMGEQMLSREYFYLGTQLPFDRFLSFYYAHAGFHLNNVFIILSVKLLLIVGINLAALTNESTICEYDRNRPITDPRKPVGCYNLIPVVEWLQRSIFSIFIVFLISFVPLCVQELTERGLWKAFTRLSKHFASWSPLFEIFVCKIYAQSLVNDLAVGGARYIATGRGFATIRIPFPILYSRFASESLYFGAISLFFVLYCSITNWKLAWIYFWFTVVGLLFCPFLYNPNQFSWNDFFLDYRNYLRWLFGGNSKAGTKDSWIGHVRSIRTRITGAKRQKLGKKDENVIIEYKKSSSITLLLSQLPSHLFTTAAIAIAYTFSNSQNDTRNLTQANSILRILLVSFGPILVNMVVLFVFFIVSCVLGPPLSVCCGSFPSLIAGIVHVIAVLNYVFFFEFLWFCQNWDFSRTVLGLALSISLQSLVFKIITDLLLTRELRHDRSSRAWWSGKWATAGLGWNVLTQPIREYLCKIIEVSLFVGDFFLGHLLLFFHVPFLLVPYIDRWHSLMLFWLKPSCQIRPQVLSTRQRRLRNGIVQIYTIVFVLVFAVCCSVFMLPTATRFFDIEFDQFLPELVMDLVQPFTIANTRKGLHSYLTTRLH